MSPPNSAPDMRYSLPSTFTEDDIPTPPAKIEHKEITIESTLSEDSLPPQDGKRAWTVAFGLYLIALSGGLPNCIMQDYYIRNNTFASESNVQVQLTFVGTLFQVLAFAFVFGANILFNIAGFRCVLFLGIFLTVVGLTLSSLATSIWQLYLAISVCTGLGTSCFSAMGLRILPQWFVKRRSTAFGVQACTYAITQLITPFVMVAINNALGPSWTLRILGFIFFAITITATLFIRERVGPSPAGAQKPKLNFAAIFKNLNMMIWVVVGPIQLYAAYTTFVFLPSYGTYIGLTDVQGGSLIAIISAIGIVGRIAAGVLGDRYGNLNTYIICMVFATISELVIWVFAFNYGMLIFFVLVNGLVYGSYLTLAAPVAINIVGMENYPAAVSVNMLAFILAIFGPLLAGYVESQNHEHPFLYCKVIAGVGFGACVILSSILRFRLNRNFIAKV
ncbi:major facilitator superfamily domain-containing protein [Fennellomyces sp. T-0311]|nr:major facilitator superfamily domain-containing protein [Fennellomyces sp. T-0311]